MPGEYGNRSSGEAAQTATSRRVHAVSDQFTATLTPAGIVLDVAVAPLRIQGATREDYLGKPFWENPGWANLPGWQETIRRRIAEVVTTGQPIVSEDCYETTDGETRFADSAFLPVRDATGTVTSIVVRAIDITDWRRTEEALRANERKLSNAMRIARLGYWEFDWETELITVDDQFYAIFRTTAADVGGYTMTTQAYTERFLPPEDRDMIARETQRALESDDGTAMSLEQRILFPNGEVGYMATRYFVVRDEQGRPILSWGANQDITDRKRAEVERERVAAERQQALEEIRATKQMLETAERIARAGSWDWNVVADQVVWSASMFAIFGVDVQEPTYALVRGLIHPDEVEWWQGYIEEMLATSTGPFDIDYRIVRPDGGVAWIHNVAEVLRDDAGRPLRMIGLSQDVTERKRNEAELARYRQHLEDVVAERTSALEQAHAKLLRQDRLATLGQLTATVSHELRNPLGTIRSSVFSIRERLPDPDDETRAILDRAERNIVRCDGIIEELLDYTRTLPVAKTPTRIDEWLARVLEEQSIPERIRLVPRLSADVQMPVDRERLRRAVINLVTNACQAMEEGDDAGGELTVETARARDRLEIRVRDTGPGIAADLRERVFEPLFSTRGFGVGLGLAITKQIAEGHAGGVALDSAPDAGTCATLWLPLPTDEGPAEIRR